jgi:SAM-dependent methyltransferase
VTPAAAAASCEVCGAGLVPVSLRRGGVLDACPSCGHLMRDLGRCPARARDFAWGGEDDMDRVRLALTYRRLAGLLQRPPRAVFEAGFGSGALLRRFADAGAEVGGADPGSLQVAVDPVVAAAGVEAVPVEDVTGGEGRYDLVYGVHVVEHVPDVWTFVSACCRLLAPGGRLALVTPAGDSAGLRTYGSSWWMLEDPTHVRFFSARSLSELLTRSGLVDVEVTRPLTDSLAVDAASTARALRRRPAPRGVLPSLATRIAVVASLPLVLPARALAPRARPTLLAAGRRRPDAG